MSIEPEYLVDFGDPERQKEFGEKYIAFLKACENLREVWENAFKAADTKSQKGQVFTFLARMALEDDFSAIVLLCADGHSNGAKQVLRAMFEKVSTIGYFHKHPREIEKFINYSWIHRRKKIDRIGPIIAGKLKKTGQQSIKEVKENAKKLKDKYGKMGWSDLGTVQMARKADIPLQIIEVGYYWGLVEAHPTLEAIINRLKIDEDGSVFYNVLPSLDQCTTPLLTAHYLALLAVEFLAKQFDVVEVSKILPRCWDEFTDVWKKEQDSLTADPEASQSQVESREENKRTDYLALFGSGRGGFATAQEADEFIRQERDAWDN